MEMILLLLLFLYGGLWRRVYGGWDATPLRSSGKTIKELAYFAVAGGTVFILTSNWMLVLAVLLTTPLIWRVGHGDYIDVGDMPHTNGDAFSPLIEKLLPKNLWGTSPYDVIALSIRYFIPTAILGGLAHVLGSSALALFYPVLGLLAGPLYWVAKQTNPQAKLAGLFDGYTAYAEFMVGGALLAGVLLL